ncbi:FKBP-type peptidyl-prolyl cis-trans isomerase [Reichenbachiella faecimaris]|uniref:peptidylprolyl isomerase n=1 Tax=Reichenbachiella faecimaris TaxID=692418 RepID=A0A1W2G5N8_REIFA|nr:FKBP-type peptidyl-prolyl cis-trans isomerase [Reichenbachiella faecimaris]SMD31844.1 FKBP-type peptidyl-prolyl cis-trans isomerase [Reichenbachiella faecimaris]
MIFNTKNLRFLFALTSLFLLSYCNDSSDPTIDQNAGDQAEIEAYLAENDTLAVADESGIYYHVIDTVPTGTSVNSGDILSIYYTAQVMNGSVIDQITRGEEDSLLLRHGVDAIYPVGLDIGLGLMKEGETYRFYIPSSLAYGDYSFSSLIPENAILEIVVEITAIHSIADIIDNQYDQIIEYISDNQLDSTIIDSTFNTTLGQWVHTDTTLFHPLDSVRYFASEQIFYKRLAEGTENDTLRRNDLATISYTGSTLDGEVFDRIPNATPLTYTFDVGEVLEGLDVGISAMERSEDALIIIPSHKAYGESVFVIPRFTKQDFVDLEIIPQYAAKVAPYEIIMFETSLLNNP